MFEFVCFCFCVSVSVCGMCVLSMEMIHSPPHPPPSTHHTIHPIPSSHLHLHHPLSFQIIQTIRRTHTIHSNHLIPIPITHSPSHHNSISWPGSTIYQTVSASHPRQMQCLAVNCVGEHAALGSKDKVYIVDLGM